MKPLELTSEHREKLLEMCKKFFPEYDEVEMTSSFPYYNANALDGVRTKFPRLEVAWFQNPTEDAVSLVFEDKDHPKSLTIHWFEFCVVHLLNKFRLEPNILLNTAMEGTHFVDYLYEEFKQIK